VKLSIYNMLGQRVRTLVRGDMETGFYRVVWDGKDDGGMDVSSGSYFCLLRGMDETVTTKLLLLR